MINAGSIGRPCLLQLRHGRPTRLSRHQQMSAEAKRMLALGESGRYEFKRDAEAVSPKVLATLANWVALDDTRDVAHLLIGVDEIEDQETGLISGKACGLPKGLDRAVARLQDVASKTRPIPVDVFIIEEAVAEEVPFIRVEGRQTRQGRSTRALADDELLRIYLDREAGSFAARFRHAGEELRSAMGAVTSQVNQIADAIDRQIAMPLAELSETAGYAASAASSAESAASTVGYDVNTVEHLVRELQDLVHDLRDTAPESLASKVVKQRRIVWWNFTVDTWKRSSVRAERLAGSLRELLSCDIALDDAHNTWELRVWGDLLKERKQQRGKRGTLKWWEAAVKEVVAFLESPAYQAPDLPELRAELRVDIDRALDDPESLTRRFRDLLDD
jgi:hypothetical protein